MSRCRSGLIDAKRSLSKAGHENPHDETAGLRAGERLQAAPEIAGAAFLIPLTAAGTWGREDPGEDGNGTLKNYEGAYAKWITSC